jgi:hypothetical protein
MRYQNRWGTKYGERMDGIVLRPLKRRMGNGSEYRDRNGYQEINNVSEFSYT